MTIITILVDSSHSAISLKREVSGVLRIKKNRMKKILCPTDFSSTSENAIAYAAKFAKHMGAELVLYNVQPMLLSPLEGKSVQSLDLETASSKLDKMSQEVSAVFKISCYAEVDPSYASVTKAISQKSNEYDLIIMGSNGPDDLIDFVTGTHAYNTAVKSAAPIMIVPPDCLFVEIKNILYAYDYLRHRSLPVQQLLPIAKAFDTDVTVLQVLEEARSQEVENDLRELQFIISQYEPDLALKFDTTHSSDTADAINAYILNNRPDLLALCTVKQTSLSRIFHKSVIKHLSSIASYPLLILHS
jgi:nucleotide-binding universal stress UspA family protein